MTTKEFITDSDSDLKELIELLDFGFATKDAFQLALKDGEIGFGDLLNFYKPLMLARGAFDGIKLIPDQWKMMSFDEKNSVMSFFAKKFTLENEGLEVLIEDTIREALGLFEIVTRWIDYRNDQNAA